MRKLFMLASMFCLTICLSSSASALDYTIQPPDGPEYAIATSVEPVATSDRSERPNTDSSKNAVLIPPGFGSPTSNLPGSGEPLYPFLYTPSSGLPGGSTLMVTPPNIGSGDSVMEPITLAYSYTEVTEDIYYSGGYLGRIKIPSLNVNVKIYEGTDSTTLAKGAGHFEETSIWAGNVCVAGHNRGVNCYFGEIHTLGIGDKITLTTKMGTRTYSVASLQKTKETDRTMLAATTDNCITLYTCVRGEPAYRWCVRAVEVK